jgi:predicted ATPase
MDPTAMNRFVVISGSSGAGKSTLLAELGHRGYAVVEEPGRRIVREEQASGGSALPWVNGVAFARRAISMALADHDAAGRLSGWVFFDRGLIDAAAALQHQTNEQALQEYGGRHRYHRRVFLAPPWPEIYLKDPERRHNLEDALAEYTRLLDAYSALGYEISLLPKVGVKDRAEFVLEALKNDQYEFRAPSFAEELARQNNTGAGIPETLQLLAKEESPSDIGARSFPGWAAPFVGAVVGACLGMSGAKRDGKRFQ